MRRSARTWWCVRFCVAAIVAALILADAQSSPAADRPAVRFAAPPITTGTVKRSKTRRLAPIVRAAPTTQAKSKKRSAPRRRVTPRRPAPIVNKGVGSKSFRVKAARNPVAKRSAPAKPRRLAPIIDKVPAKPLRVRTARKLVPRSRSHSGKTAPIINRVPTADSPSTLHRSSNSRSKSFANKKKKRLAVERYRQNAPERVRPPAGNYRQGNRVVRIQPRQKKSLTVPAAGRRSLRRPGRRPVIVKLLEDGSNSNQPKSQVVQTVRGRNVVRFVQTMFEKQSNENRLRTPAGGGLANRESVTIPRNRSRHVLLRTVVIAKSPQLPLPPLNRLPLVFRKRVAGVLVRQVKKSEPAEQQPNKASAVKQAAKQPKNPNDPEFKPFSSVTTAIAATGKDFPPNLAAGPFAKAGKTEQREGASRTWTETMYFWEPAALCHNPLYFEEVNLERYGYTRGKVIQPVVSAAHFFGSVVALPYLTAADRPRDCIYTLGHYRPGSYAPYRFHFPPRSTPAGIIEAGVVTGLIFAFP